MATAYAEQTEFHNMESGPERGRPRGVWGVIPEIVTVIWGPIKKELDIQGVTVADARRGLRGPLGIPENEKVVPLVNGEEAAPERRLAPGDTCEWVHRAGEKG
jgi:hypothetical protein